jgi:hypothetical protein
VGDIEVSWRLRGSDEDVASRAQRVLAYVAKLQQAATPPAAPAVPPPAPTPAAPQTQGTPQCPMHGGAKVKRSTLFAGHYCTAQLGKDEQGKTLYCKWTQRDN